MSRQWVVVLCVVGGLGLGSAALVKMGSRMERVEVGSRMPDFRLIDARTGDSLSLRQRYQGSVTLVNIWATWCVPCRTEMPAMEKAYNAFKSRGFRIAAVSIDEDDPQVVLDFAKELGLTFELLHDRTRRGIEQAYQTTGVLESFLVNQDGIIVRRVIGAHDWDSPLNRNLIERLLNEAGAPPAPAATPGPDSTPAVPLGN